MAKPVTYGKKPFSLKAEHDDADISDPSLYGQLAALQSTTSATSLSASALPSATRTLSPTTEVSTSTSATVSLSAMATPVASAITYPSTSISKVYQHWADGDAARATAPEWNNNILSDGKSDYFEGEVVPHVYFYKASNNTPLVNGQSYSFNVTYNHYQANTNAGGFVYMTSPNASRNTSSFAGGDAQADSSFTNGGGMQGSFYTVNANITAVSGVSYLGSAGSSLDGKVTVTFTYTGPTTTSGGAEIQYGLLIAAPGDVADQGKGMTDGANAWTGGSLQTTVDIGGSGATSIQLAPSAIIVGEISGMKFSDVDGNGVRDADGADNTLGTADDEVGLANWKIFLDKDNDGLWDEGEDFAMTDANGQYVLSVIPDADRSDIDNDPYIVREVQQTGWQQTTANPTPILITRLDPKEMNVDFGNMQLQPSLNIVKEASVDGAYADYAGEVIHYTIAVENTGNQTLTGVTVTDPFISDLQLVADAASSDGELDVGETWHYTASHTVTQAEIDAGVNIVNTATADSDQTGPDTDDASVPVLQAPALAIDKAITGVTGGNGNGSVDAVNDVIGYAVTVTNTGNQTLNQVTVNDPMTGLTISGVTLAPGASQTYQTSYTLTQNDLDTYGGGDGYIENTATADSLETASVSDTEAIELFVRSALSIDKRLVDITGGNNNTVADAVGDTLNYTVTVSNLGVLTLTNVSVVDPNSGLNITGVTLAPGESQVYTTSYVLTQADLDNNGQGDGYIDNIATADSDQTVPVSDNESTALLRTVGLGIEKNVTSVAGGNNNLFADAAGEVIQYTIRVYNAGSVTLTGVTVTDELTGLSENVPDLAPGASATYNTSYTLLQADLDNNGGGDGRLDNTSVADSDQTSAVSDSESVQLLAVPILYVNKSFLNVTGGNGNDLADAVGDQLNYQIVLANPGNVTLTDVSVTESLTGLNDTGMTLAPNAVQVYNVSYTLTQTDLDNNGGGDGTIDNSVIADSAQTLASSDTESVPVLSSIGIAFDKDFVGVSGGNENALADFAGDVLNYSFTVTNIGSVTLTNVSVVDDLTGLSETLASLAPGVTQTYTSSYTLLQSDLDTDGDGNRQVENYATADSDQTGPLLDFEGVTVIYDAQIDLTKYVSVDGGSTWDDANTLTGPTLSASAGLNPLFKYTALNNGTVTLQDVTLTDPAYDLNGSDAGTHWSWGDLAPGVTAELIFEAPFMLGQNSGDATVVATALSPVLDIDNAYYLGV
ncbi:DUF11 domain-containing protein [Limnohabitans sp. Hippo3]|uniref:beta strand repeat-containing protein n=1 Tax=Limnohabitans sp. Hippo3 TaxID=1597956 RepID=UPI000D3DAF23|nr:DUF11 domain-containing protein [Limnohabitans sp. Hippo3]PUE43923.1 hypothetical protein B9Z34_03700 [Limnohabitans sp. Hippo3]